jgi:hypothetical protein
MLPFCFLVKEGKQQDWVDVGDVDGIPGHRKVSSDGLLTKRVAKILEQLFITIRRKG